MKPIGPILIALSLPAFQTAVASADDRSPPKTTATRPAGEHRNETSLPNYAPPATATQTTGSRDQSPVVKEMNAEELEKVKKEGK
jgi:hypothetical protein